MNRVKKIGRPKLPEPYHDYSYILFARQGAMIEQMAAARGMNKSEFLRTLIDEEYARMGATVPAMTGD